MWIIFIAILILKLLYDAAMGIWAEVKAEQISKSRRDLNNSIHEGDDNE